MERIYKKEITFLSNYSWDNPNVLELLCETASYREKNIKYFSKPQSIFRKFKKYQSRSFIKSIDSKPLFNFSVKLSKYPIIRTFQNNFIWKQIYAKKKENELKVLIYNNLDSIYLLKRYLKKHFDLLIYLCEDYSNLNERLISNCKIADCILVIPNSMIEVIQKNFPQKKIILWPQPVTNISQDDISQEDKRMINDLLSKIPKPRIIYSGHGLDRVDKNIFIKVSQYFENFSFIYFGEESNINADNVFRLPSFTKHQMKYIISKSNIGFMPYDITNSHNFHCVPLKLFDYFSEGLPVVSSVLLNVRQYDHLIYMCQSVDEFYHAIEKAVSESIFSKNRTKRKEIFDYHSTHSRSEDFDNILLELLHLKSSVN